jgi:hypothetical protein
LASEQGSYRLPATTSLFLEAIDRVAIFSTT